MVITFEENIFDGETMVTQWRFQGTDLGKHARSQIEPTGKQVDYRGVDVLNIEDGKIKKDHPFINQLEVMQQ